MDLWEMYFRKVAYLMKFYIFAMSYFNELKNKYNGTVQ